MDREIEVSCSASDLPVLQQTRTKTDHDLLYVCFPALGTGCILIGSLRYLREL